MKVYSLRFRIVATLRIVSACAVLGWGGAGRADIPDRTGPDRLAGSTPPNALLHVNTGSGWGAGGLFRADRRDLRLDNGGALDLSSRSLLAHLDLPVASFAGLRLEAGWVRADAVQQTGDSGVSLGMRMEANLAEIVLKTSPVFGRVETLGLGAATGYRWAQSDLPSRALDWTEWTLSGFVRYESNRRGQITSISSFEPAGVAVRAGLEMDRVDGTLEGESFRQHRGLGLLLGADLKWTSSWTTGLQATFFSEKDRTLEFSLSRYF